MILGWIAGIMAVAAGAGVILARNTVHSALFLIANFIAVAVLFLGLHAEFLALIEVIVYAGAIMVLFLFVVTVLSVDKGPDNALPSPLGGQTAGGFILGIVVFVVLALGVVGAGGALGPAVPAAFGSVAAFGRALFTTYVYPFELTAFILLVAVVGAVSLTRSLKTRGDGN